MASADALPVSPAEALAALTPMPGRDGVVLAVSGGADSLALLHLWADARALEPNLPRAVVVSIDHGLRAEARDEAAFVGRIAVERGLAHRVLRWEGEKPVANLQAEARAARRRLLAEAARAEGLDTVVLAHHADDQAETFLLRLARGSGVAGLAGMARVRRDDGLAWFRPLLTFPKARLVATLAARGATWIEDPSNGDARFERARMRAAMPGLAALGLSRDRLVATAAAMARGAAVIDDAVDDLMRRAGTAHPAGWVRLEAGLHAAARAEVRLRLLSRLIATVGEAAYGPRLAACEELDAALGAGERVVRTLAGVRVERRRGFLWFVPEAGRTRERVVRPGERISWAGRIVAVDAAAPGPVTIGPLGEAGRRAFLAGRCLCADRLGRPAPSAGVLAGATAIRDARGATTVPGLGPTAAGEGGLEGVAIGGFGLAGAGETVTISS